MTKLFKQFTFPVLAVLLLVHGNVRAEEETGENTEVSEGHISVGSREFDPELREQIEKQRAYEHNAENAVNAQQTLRKASYKFSEASSPFQLAPRQLMNSPQITLAAAYPINGHWLASIADNYRSIEIEDGSHWEIATADAFILRNWRRDDTLVITPNYNWFSSYDYYIVNKSRNTYVKANLYIGPIAFGQFSHWIVDMRGDHIFLENQMIWSFHPDDGNIVKHWAINDHIILGVYESWLSPYDHILINVNMDNHVRVKQY